MIPLIGGTVTTASRHFGHYLALGVNSAVFLFSIIFVYRQSARRTHRPTHWQRMGPTYLTVLAALLVLADNLRHVLQDLEVWPAVPPQGAWYPSSSQYRPGCPVESFECLSAVGWVFTVVLTYTGFATFFFATMWNANLPAKLEAIAARWRALRDADRAAAEREAVGKRAPPDEGDLGGER